MARPIKTTTEIQTGIRIQNIYTSGKSDYNDIYCNDMFLGLQYVENQEVVTLDGRLEAINFTTINGVSSYKNITDPLAKRIRVNSITVDHSEEYHSHLSKIPAKEILEYFATDEAARVKVLPIIQVVLTVTLSNGEVSTMVLREGETLSNAVVMTENGDVTQDLPIKSFVYTLIPKSMSLTVSGIVLDDGKNTNVDLLAIKSCGLRTESLGEDTVQEAIDRLKATEGEEALSLTSTVVETPLSIGGEITIKGAKANITAAKGVRATDEIAEDETIFVESVACEKNADVTIQGVAFTEKSLINVGDAKSVTFKNCKFVSMTPDAAKSFLVRGNGFNGEVPTVKVMMEDCYFGNNPSGDTNRIYNGMEFNFNLANGSYIKNCYFAENFSSNNAICVYGMEPGATIRIIDNTFEKSANAIRIGIVGEPTGNILIEGNTYLKTDSNPEYAGLVLVQPYGNKTVSMAGVRVDINKTKKPSGQLFYGYFGGKDTQMNSGLWPKMYVDGKKQFLTLGDEVTENIETPSI